MSLRVACLSVVPSPYQRDLFAALAARPEVSLEVAYLESAAPDSPWPIKPLAPFERILSGFWFPLGSARCHVNWPLPAFRQHDFLIVNTLMSLTAQAILRLRLTARRWIFWGERLGGSSALHRALSAPLHRATGIAAIGQRAAADYRSRFPGQTIWNVPYHCDLSNFLAATRPPRAGSRTVFLFCGQMIARKGLDLLLEAFSGLPEECELLLVGREAELPQLLAPLPAAVSSRITYAGFQAPEALPRFFAQADVFVLPSRYDGWGVVVNQALGAGLPIVCSDEVGAGYDLVEPGVNGTRYPHADVAALRAALLPYITQPQHAATQGAASRRLAADYTPARGAERWLQLFEEAGRKAA